jgi:hypothetical protein
LVADAVLVEPVSTAKFPANREINREYFNFGPIRGSEGVAMVLRYGMSDALGSVAYDRDRSPFLQPNLPVPQERSYSEDTAHAVDAAVRTLVDHALEHAAAILQRNRALLDRTAIALLETETLNEPDIVKLKQTIVRDGPGPAMLPRAEAPAHSAMTVSS